MPNPGDSENPFDIGKLIGQYKERARQAFNDPLRALNQQTQRVTDAAARQVHRAQQFVQQKQQEFRDFAGQTASRANRALDPVRAPLQDVSQSMRHAGQEAQAKVEQNRRELPARLSQLGQQFGSQFTRKDALPAFAQSDGTNVFKPLFDAGHAVYETTPMHKAQLEWQRNQKDLGDQIGKGVQQGYGQFVHDHQDQIQAAQQFLHQKQEEGKQQWRQTLQRAYPTLQAIDQNLPFQQQLQQTSHAINDTKVEMHQQFHDWASAPCPQWMQNLNDNLNARATHLKYYSEETHVTQVADTVSNLDMAHNLGKGALGILKNPKAGQAVVNAVKDTGEALRDVHPPAPRVPPLRYEERVAAKLADPPVGPPRLAHPTGEPVVPPHIPPHPVETPPGPPPLAHPTGEPVVPPHIPPHPVEPPPGPPPLAHPTGEPVVPPHIPPHPVEAPPGPPPLAHPTGEPLVPPHIPPQPIKPPPGPPPLANPTGEPVVPPHIPPHPVEAPPGPPPLAHPTGEPLVPPLPRRAAGPDSEIPIGSRSGPRSGPPGDPHQLSNAARRQQEAYARSVDVANQIMAPARDEGRKNCLLHCIANYHHVYGVSDLEAPLRPFQQPAESVGDLKNAADRFLKDPGDSGWLSYQHPTEGFKEIHASNVNGNIVLREMPNHGRFIDPSEVHGSADFHFKPGGYPVRDLKDAANRFLPADGDSGLLSYRLPNGKLTEVHATHANGQIVLRNPDSGALVDPLHVHGNANYKFKPTGGSHFEEANSTGFDRRAFESYFGGQFHPVPGPDDPQFKWWLKEPGSSGMLCFTVPEKGTKHVVHAVNIDGQIVFMDRQSKQVMSMQEMLSVKRDYEFLPTPQPVGYIGTPPYGRTPGGLRPLAERVADTPAAAQHLPPQPPAPPQSGFKTPGPPPDEIGPGSRMDRPSPPNPPGAGGPPTARPFGMRPQDEEVFAQAARDHGRWIIVRETNPEALKYIGDPNCVPKPFECKAKSANVPEHPYAGLVVDPNVHPSAFRDPAEAAKEWNKLEEVMKTDHRFQVDTEGRLTFNGKHVHADYDVYDVVDPQKPVNLSPVTVREDGQVMYETRGLRPIGEQVNREIGSPMIQHAGEAQFQGHSDQRLIVFGPDGQRFITEDQKAIEDVYQNRFQGRYALDHPQDAGNVEKLRTATPAADSGNVIDLDARRQRAQSRPKDPRAESIETSTKEQRPAPQVEPNPLNPLDVNVKQAHAGSVQTNPTPPHPAQPVEGKPGDHQPTHPTERQPSESVQTKPTTHPPTQPAQGKPSESVQKKPTEQRPAQPVEGKQSEPVQTKPTDQRPPQPVQGTPESVQTKPPEQRPTQPAQNKSTESVQTKPTEPRPPQPAQNKPTESVHTKPPEQRPTQPAQNKPIESVQTKPPEPRPPQPVQGKPSEPVQTKPPEQRPAQPAEGKPSESVQTKPTTHPPTQPAQGKPAESVQTKPTEQRPAQPVQGKPSESAQTKPTEQRPTQPAQGKPSEPVQTKPPEQRPAQPAEGKPSESVQTKPTTHPPTQPAQNKPSESVQTKPTDQRPTQPAEAKPSEPVQTKPPDQRPPQPIEGKPAESIQTKPADHQPTQPVERKPSESLQAKPTDPSPAQPAEAKPAEAKSPRTRDLGPDPAMDQAQPDRQNLDHTQSVHQPGAKASRSRDLGPDPGQPRPDSAASQEIGQTRAAGTSRSRDLGSDHAQPPQPPAPQPHPPNPPSQDSPTQGQATQDHTTQPRGGGQQLSPDQRRSASEDMRRKSGRDEPQGEKLSASKEMRHKSGRDEPASKAPPPREERPSK